MITNTEPVSTRPSTPPLGTGGDQSRRLLLHHVPLALVSVMVLVLFMTLPVFDTKRFPHGDIISGTFPQEPAVDHTGPMGHGANHSRHMGHGRDHTGPMRHGGVETSAPTETANETRPRLFLRQFTVASGYVAVGFLALTLLIGPANLLLHKRNPVSNYLRRDIGMWTAAFSFAHVIFGLQLHGGRGGQISRIFNYFVAADGSLLTNSFGLGNWTGLVALLIVGGLLVTSNDAGLRKLKAKPWKWLQRLNYALFGLVILHAIFYGALLRVTSPFTLLLGLSVIAVLIGQMAGVWLWRRRCSFVQHSK